jgi:hypothetical protein
MPIQYTVDYSTDGTSWSALSNIESISAFVGKSGLTDTFEPSRATIVMRYPSGYSSPNTALVVGTWIRFQQANGVGFEMWRGRIRNVTVDWGKKYQSGVGAADFMTMECEGALAEWGRQSGEGASIAASDLQTQMTTVAAIGSLNWGSSYPTGTYPQMAASTVDNSLLNWVNTAAATTGSFLKDGSGILGLNTKDFIGTLPVSFSDVTKSSTVQDYDGLTFDSLAQDYFTQVQVDMNSGTVVSRETGSAPYRTLRMSTFSASTAQATDLADWLLGVYSRTSFGISEVSTVAASQASTSFNLGYAYWDLPGYRTTLVFRGTTYTLTILGVAFTANAEESRFTYSVIDADLTPYLYLDSATYGILDTNRLNW